MFVAGGSASRQGGPRVRSAKLQDRDAVALSFALDDRGILPDRMKDGLPKLKDFPAELGGSGVAVPE